jgi:hypothetical protein
MSCPFKRQAIHHRQSGQADGESDRAGCANRKARAAAWISSRRDLGPRGLQMGRKEIEKLFGGEE